MLILHELPQEGEATARGSLYAGGALNRLKHLEFAQLLDKQKAD